MAKKENVWEPETDTETAEEEENQTVPLKGVRKRKQEVTAAVVCS